MWGARSSRRNPHGRQRRAIAKTLPPEGKPDDSKIRPWTCYTSAFDVHRDRETGGPPCRGVHHEKGRPLTLLCDGVTNPNSVAAAAASHAVRQGCAKPADSASTTPRSLHDPSAARHVRGVSLFNEIL